MVENDPRHHQKSHLHQCSSQFFSLPLSVNYGKWIQDICEVHIFIHKYNAWLTLMSTANPFFLAPSREICYDKNNTKMCQGPLLK